MLNIYFELFDSLHACRIASAGEQLLLSCEFEDHEVDLLEMHVLLSTLS